jgi:formylglycine-generating enzyme required for sulfatase activity
MNRLILTAWLLSIVSAGPAIAADARGVAVLPVLQAGQGQARALLVGVNDYERLTDLRFCEADVTGLRERLVEIGFDRQSVKCLTTGASDSALRPSFRNVTEQLDALFAGLDADSVLVIALSGHGGSFEWKDAGGREHTESFFCPQDARLTDPVGTMISLPKIYERLEKCPARFKLLLTDACRDRHFVPADARVAGKTAVDEARSIAGFADGVKSLSDARRLPKGTLAMVSCSSGEQSWEDRDLQHGIFMYYVLEALAGRADREYRGDGNGVVCFREFKDYVYRKTSDHAWRAHSGSPQTPNFYANWELPNFDLVEVLRREPPVYTGWPYSASEAGRRQAATAAVLGQPVEWSNSVGMKFKLIPAGEFVMGSPREEVEGLVKEYPSLKEYFEVEQPQHRVRITRPYYLGMHEATQSEYERVMGTNPSWFARTGKGSDRVSGQDTSRFPVENVSWDDAQEFCRKLSALSAEQSAGRGYRLPTEAEWEHACRAGTATPFHFGTQLNGRDANCDGSEPYGTTTKGPYLQRTTRVGSYEGNVFGLYDMHGNVWEWCSDWFADYAPAVVDDPTGATAGSFRVYRGGGWYFGARYCRSADRHGNAPDFRFDFLGFRLAFSPVDASVR